MDTNFHETWFIDTKVHKQFSRHLAPDLKCPITVKENLEID